MEIYLIQFNTVARCYEVFLKIGALGNERRFFVERK